jgi:hypothetical protein
VTRNLALGTLRLAATPKRQCPCGDSLTVKGAQTPVHAAAE